MKKLLLVVLIVILLFAVSLAEAKVEFGSWDKWDEQLPLADNKAWMSVFPNMVLWKMLLDEDSGLTFYFSSTVFFKDKNKSSKTAAKAMFYFLDYKVLETEDWKIREAISNATFAVVAFPPKTKKDEMITIRAYKREQQELKFFEEWKIPYKDEKSIIKKEMPFFKEFLKELEKFKYEYDEDLLDTLLPKILYDEDMFFIMPGTAYRKS